MVGKAFARYRRAGESSLSEVRGEKVDLIMRLSSVMSRELREPNIGADCRVCKSYHFFECSFAATVSARYVHPSVDAVLAAMSKLSEHNSRHSEETLLNSAPSERALSA